MYECKKMGFGSHGEAKRFFKDRKRLASKAGRIRTYFCDNCKKVHITSHEKNKERNKKRKKKRDKKWQLVVE